MCTTQEVGYANPTDSFHFCAVEACTTQKEHWYIVEGTSGAGNFRFRHTTPTDYESESLRRKLGDPALR